MYTNLKNNIDFFIRNLLKISRKNFQETSAELIERNKLENKYTSDILEQYFKKRNINHTRILDIGSKNWFYAKGEHAFFQSFCNDFILDGIELDAYRLYSNLYNRLETARYHTKGLKNTNYITGNLLDIKDKYDYIIWFLPFVTAEPLRYWGLPMRYFCPEKLLKHAYNLLNNNGQLLIINQTKEEAKVQKQLLQNLNIKFTELGEVKSVHLKYKYERFGFLIDKILT